MPVEVPGSSEGLGRTGDPQPATPVGRRLNLSDKFFASSAPTAILLPLELSLQVAQLLLRDDLQNDKRKGRGQRHTNEPTCLGMELLGFWISLLRKCNQVVVRLVQP